jgi:chorismate mutase
MELLKTFRDQIDTIDREIIYLLSRRFEIVKQIWIIKKQNDIQPLQTWRWEQVLQNLMLEAQDKWVNQDFVKTVWEEIHKEALRLEKM